MTYHIPVMTMNNEQSENFSKGKLFEKLQWLALHPGTPNFEAAGAFHQLRKLSSCYDLSKLLAELGSDTRRSLDENKASEQRPTTFQDAIAQVRQEFAALRDASARQAVELAEAKRYISVLEETISQLKAEAHTPAAPPETDHDATLVRNDAVDRASVRRRLPGREPLAALRRRVRYRLRAVHRGRDARTGGACARRGGAAWGVQEPGIHPAAPGARDRVGRQPVGAGGVGGGPDRFAASSGGVARVIAPPSGARIWLTAGVTDMRKGMDGLASQVRQTLGRHPHAGDLYVFRNRRGNALKVLWHDGTGMNLHKRRLERGRFAWPEMQEGVVALTPAALATLLDGAGERRPRRTQRPEAAG